MRIMMRMTMTMMMMTIYYDDADGDAVLVADFLYL